jgi:hypothetical protein
MESRKGKREVSRLAGYVADRSTCGEGTRSGLNNRSRKEQHKHRVILGLTPDLRFHFDKNNRSLRVTQTVAEKNWGAKETSTEQLT